MGRRKIISENAEYLTKTKKIAGNGLTASTMAVTR
jgi:hypothetical protein